MTTTAQILTRAQALAEADECSCAHLAITLASSRLGCYVELAEVALQLYARANSLSPSVITDCGSIHRFWDNADQATRIASWARAKAVAMGEG